MPYLWIFAGCYLIAFIYRKFEACRSDGEDKSSIKQSRGFGKGIRGQLPRWNFSASGDIDSRLGAVHFLPATDWITMSWIFYFFMSSWSVPNSSFNSDVQASRST
jgi:hypothetical protein